MLISELSEITGLSKDTIRFYEKEGLLDAALSTRSENNYRQYTPEAVERLNFIKRGKALGFTLREIKSIMAEWDSVTPEQAIDFIDSKLQQIDGKINQLQQFKNYLVEKKARLESGATLSAAAAKFSEDCLG
ncbi:MAG: MerR family transcriptional regulator [Oscillatoria sp. SIO1A7]|nr:MerR family transcriptional regulator [Oscillatoria sp. SIO1A7]